MSNEQLIKELTKLSTKMDSVGEDIAELKLFMKETQSFVREALLKLKDLDYRVTNLEEWKEQITRSERLKKRFTYDLRSAIAGGLAGGGTGALLAWLFKFVH